MAKIIDRVFVYDDRVIALALHPDFGIILDVPESAPSDVLAAVTESSKKARETSQSSVPRTGATGLYPSLGTFIWAPPKRVYHLVVRELIKLITGVQS